MAKRKHIRLLDTTCRDGMHAMAHQFTPDDMAAIAGGAEAAGIDTFECAHGDGLGGSSLQYGIAAAGDEEYLTAAASQLKNTKLGILLLPGVGIKEDLMVAARCGVRVARIATHVTEADIAEQHIRLSNELGMEAIGVLMMTHMVPPEKILEQASLMQSYGAQGIYLMDSAGALLTDGVRARVSLLVRELSIPVGFHAHNNLSMAISNTITAIEAGASMVDGCMRGLGAGAGNAQLEVLVGVLDKLGYDTGVNFYKAMDSAENIVQPRMKRPQVIDNAALVLGYAGVYSSFLLHAYRAAKKYDVDPRDILVELGMLRIVGGQEDMIVQVAHDLAKKK